jgi:hypothetical protein
MRLIKGGQFKDKPWKMWVCRYQSIIGLLTLAFFGLFFGSGIGSGFGFIVISAAV